MRATNVVLIFAFLAGSVHSEDHPDCYKGSVAYRGAFRLPPVPFDRKMAAILDKKYPKGKCPKSKPPDELGYNVHFEGYGQQSLDRDLKIMACSDACHIVAFGAEELTSAGSTISIYQSTATTILVFISVFF